MEDKLNYGYCCWFLGKIDEAISSFRKYISSLNEKERMKFDFDRELLKDNGISETQAKLMYAAVFS